MYLARGGIVSNSNATSITTKETKGERIVMENSGTLEEGVVGVMATPRYKHHNGEKNNGAEMLHNKRVLTNVMCPLIFLFENQSAGIFA